jgi:uncharacterized membrane protein YkoI
MKLQIYAAVIALCGASGLAQDQNQNPAQQTPLQTPQTQPGVGQQPAGLPGVPTTRDRAAQALSNIIADWRFEDLPPAVQKTVREQSAGQEIADIDREDRTGRTIWEVEFDREGRNTEIHVAEDGTLMPESDRLFGLSVDSTPARPGERTPSAGTPAGTQTGRSAVALALGTQWEDLPKAVQQKAMPFGGKEKVADIDREEWRGKVAYEIEFRREGRNLEIHFGEDGTILESNDPATAPAQGSAPGTETGVSPSTPQPIQPPVQPEPRLEPLPQPQPDQKNLTPIRP